MHIAECLVIPEKSAMGCQLYIKRVLNCFRERGLHTWTQP